MQENPTKFLLQSHSAGSNHVPSWIHELQCPEYASPERVGACKFALSSCRPIHVSYRQPAAIHTVLEASWVGCLRPLMAMWQAVTNHVLMSSLYW